MSTNYVQAVIDHLDELIPDNDPNLIRLYALLALSKGADTSLEDVHDAWAIWRNTTRPDHPALVPFGHLAVDVQELDRKYMRAIRAAAHRRAAQDICRALNGDTTEEDHSDRRCSGPCCRASAELNPWEA